MKNNFCCENYYIVFVSIMKWNIKYYETWVFGQLVLVIVLCAHFYLLFSLRHKISISFLKSPAVYSCVWLTDNHEILSWLKQLTAMNSVVHTKFYLIVEAKNLILTNFVHFVNLNYFWNLKHLVIPLLYTGLCQHQAVTPIFFPHTSACL